MEVTNVKKLLLCVALLLMPFVSCAKTPLQASRDSYVELHVEGHGFTCGATAVGRRTVVTAEHCVTEDGKFVAGLTVDGQPPVKIILDGQEHALILVAQDLHKRPVKLANKPVAIGDKLFVYGRPMDMGLLFREGIYSGNVLLSGMLPNNWRVTSIMGAPGDSGSGIFDKDGRLVGSVSIGLNIAVFGPAWSPLGWHDYNFTAAQWKEGFGG